MTLTTETISGSTSASTSTTLYQIDNLIEQKKARVFEPVILFHDHTYFKDESCHLEQIRIQYGDPHYVSLIEQCKQKTQHMLTINGKLWLDQLRDDTMTLQSPSSPPSSSSSSSSSSSLSLSSPISISSPSLLPTVIMSTPLPSSHTPSSQMSRQKRRSSICDGRGKRGPGYHDNGHRRALCSFSGSYSDSSKPTTAKTATAVHRKRRGNLPKEVTAVLRDWLAHHKLQPYPTEEEKLLLSKQTNLTISQISNWFINARRRILIPMLEEEKTQNRSMALLQ